MPNSSIRIILFDDDYREQFLPLTWTRPLADLRLGIFTIREKWEKWLKADSTTATVEYLADRKWKFEPDSSKQNIWINARVLPSPELVMEILRLGNGDALLKGESIIALNNGSNTDRLNFAAKDHPSGDFGIMRSDAPCITLHRIHDIFLQNGKAILQDFELLKGFKSETLSATNTIIGSHPLLIGKNVKAEACVFNVSKGPILIGDNAEIMEGSLLRGPLVIGEHAVVKMGAKIYGDTTIGPGCKVGGEISNSVFYANSNKAHDGFIGNSVIGEWVNLGADTNCSNLKNNYGNVSVYNYSIDGEEDTGLQFHGCIIGDHAKCGINTMLNTGTIIGVGANVFGGGFPPKFLPDFSWGGTETLVEAEIEKSLENISRVYSRRSLKLEKAENDMLRHIHKSSTDKRKKRLK